MAKKEAKQDDRCQCRGQAIDNIQDMPHAKDKGAKGLTKGTKDSGGKNHKANSQPAGGTVVEKY
jgi:hypothetical protein